MLGLVASSFPTSSQGWLDLLVVVSLKATLVLALAGLLSLMLVRASAAARHLAWSVAMVGLLALPPLALWGPGFGVRGLDLPRPSAAIGQPRIELSHAGAEALDESPAVPRGSMKRGIAGEPVTEARREVVRTAARAGASKAASPARPVAAGWTLWILAVWGAGALLMTVWLALGLAVLAGLSRGARRVTDPELGALFERCKEDLRVHGPIELWSSQRTPVPCTWGVLRPRVLIPEEAVGWPAERLRVVLLHELAHVARRDCLVQTLAQFACALFWFHPLAWYAARRMRIERERACDDRVLDCDTDAADYADHLLAVVRAMQGHGLAVPGAVAFARPSQLEGRLLALLDSQRVRGSLTAPRARVAAVVAALVVLPLALLRPWASPAGADLTLSDANLARPERAAPSEVLQAPAEKQSLDRRLSWALAEGRRRGAGGYWIAYAIPRGSNDEGQMSDSGALDLRTLDPHWPGPRMSDVLAGRRMKDPDVKPNRDLLVLEYHVRARGTGPRDVDRVRVQTMGLPADFGRQPLYWLGQVEDQESFDWARRVEDAAPSRHLRAAALEVVALHGDDDAVRGHLREVLKSQVSDEVRAAAAERLARFEDPGTLDVLVSTLHEDRSEEVRQSAVEALGQMRSPQSVRVLSKMARDSNESGSIRRAAIEALGEKAGDDAAAETLEELVGSDTEQGGGTGDEEKEGGKPGKRLKGGEAKSDKRKILSKPYGQDIVVYDEHGRPEVTIQQRRDSKQTHQSTRTVQVQDEQDRQEARESIQRQAVESLGQLSPEASLPKLVKIANTHPVQSVRHQAIEAIADLGTDEALRVLSKIAWDPKEENDDLEQQAVEGIAQFDAAASRLCPLAKHHRSPGVRRRAVEALGDLGPKDEVLATLDEVLRSDPDEDVQRQAVESISELPEDVSLPRLERIARSHRSVAVRRQAIEALGDANPAKAAPILENLIKGK